MTHFERDCFRNRIQLVLNNLRLCNGGNEAHVVGNMRHRSQLILDLLNDETIMDDHVTTHDMVCRLEAECVEFFKKKYSHLKK